MGEREQTNRKLDIDLLRAASRRRGRMHYVGTSVGSCNSCHPDVLRVAILGVFDRCASHTLRYPIRCIALHGSGHRWNGVCEIAEVTRCVPVCGAALGSIRHRE